MGASESLLVFWIGGSCIAGLTWFFSSRPRLFVRVFVPREDWREAIRFMVRDPNFGRNMKQMSLIQFVFVGLFGIVGLWLRYA
jgi:hypothetical protein